MAENSDDEASRRSKYFILAVIAERAGRYDDMVDFMEKFARVATSSGDLTREERMFFSLANKGLANAHRKAWKVASSTLKKMEAGRREARAALVRAFRARVEADITAVCTRVIEFVDSVLIPSAGSSEARVFYLKMRGDYQRYLAEFKEGKERKEAADASMDSYMEAESIAVADLEPTNALRLGLAVNFAVLYREVLDLPREACSKASKAWHEAVELLVNLSTEAEESEESEKDSFQMMLLLHENVDYWMNELQVKDFHWEAGKECTMKRNWISTILY